MITKTTAAFLIGALIAGSAQATLVDSGDGLPDTSPSVGTVYHGTVYDYLCPGADGGLLLYIDWPFSASPTSGCIAFGGTPGLLWSVADYPLIYDPSNYFTFNNLPDASNSSGGFEQTWTVSNVNVVPVPVPEPQTLAIFLTGLGLIGFMAGRKPA